MEVPNTTFTKIGWPARIKVDVRQRPFPAGPITVHFQSYFNGAWQRNNVLAELGNNEGQNLKGAILKPTEPEASAIALVKAAVLSVPGQGRSSGDVQANLDLYSSSMTPGKGWNAKSAGPKSYDVSYDFIDGRGNEQAIWTADLSTGAVKYVNEAAKVFSWTPKD